jgi:hypothetical protein
MAVWMILSRRESFVLPGTHKRRQIGGSVSMSVTLSWYVLGSAASPLLAIAFRPRTGRAAHRPLDYFFSQF